VIIVFISNPVFLMTITVFIGIILGNLKLGRLSFSTSGSMFVGIVLGWAVVNHINTIAADSEFYQIAQDVLAKNIIDKGFFDLFLILFIASVGLLAAKEVGRVIKIYGIKFVILGFVITLIGAASTYSISLITPMDNPYYYSGVYTGALTSSPGLASSIESARVHSFQWIENYELLSDYDKQRILNIVEEDKDLKIQDNTYLTPEQKNNFVQLAEAGVGTGYAVGYPFGVIIVIFAMNFFPIIFKIDLDKEKLILDKELKYDSREKDNRIKGETHQKTREVYFDLCGFSLVCLIGFLIGSLKVSFATFGEISLGTTGGVLVSALVLGHIGKVGPFCFRMDSRVLGLLRKITLAFFFSTIGLRYGYQVIDSLTGPGLTLAIASFFIGLIAMFSGFILGRYIFKINWIMLSGAICGGMTSTPGLGSAIDAVGSDEPAAGYGAVYPFALLGMVIFSNLLNQLI
jgi:putative transport protein